MKIRVPEYARGLARSCARTGVLAASLFTLTPPAAAQPDPADGAPEPSATDAEPTPEGEPAEPPEAAPATEPADRAAEKAVEAESESAASTAGIDASASAKGPGPDAEPEPALDASTEAAVPPPLRLELLPPTAYPSTPTPGIPWGSLGLVIDRLQWPYMPKYPGPPELRVGLSGFGWVDSSYRSLEAGLETEDDQSEYRMQGRFGLRVTPVYNLEEDYFLQANFEFIANVDQDHTVSGYTDVDDAWIRVGKWKYFDFQIGRMQGFEVYHFGMGLDQNTYERQGAVSFSSAPAQPYGLTDLWDRGLSTGAAALHWYFPEWLRLEVLTRFGLSGQGSDLGVRPVGVVDLGWLKLKAGYERRLRPSIFEESQARIETQGYGGELQFVLDPWIELGGGYAKRLEDAFENDGAVRPSGSTNTQTYGGFLNVRPYFEDWLVGFGYHHTDWENYNFDDFGERENSTHDQMFGALQYVLWDKLYLKYVLAYAKGHIEDRNDSNADDTGFENKALSHRLRLMVLF